MHTPRGGGRRGRGGKVWRRRRRYVTRAEISILPVRHFCHYTYTHKDKTNDTALTRRDINNNNIKKNPPSSFHTLFDLTTRSYRRHYLFTFFFPPPIIYIIYLPTNVLSLMIITHDQLSLSLLVYLRLAAALILWLNILKRALCWKIKKKEKVTTVTIVIILLKVLISQTFYRPMCSEIRSGEYNTKNIYIILYANINVFLIYL